MKSIFTFIMAALGLATACGQKNYTDADAEEFARLIADTTIMVVDVRTAEEYNSGHLDRAINIDFKKPDFEAKAKALLPKGKTIAIYCRSGRRSALAAQQLAPYGYKFVNLKGGILEWNAK